MKELFAFVVPRRSLPRPQGGRPHPNAQFTLTNPTACGDYGVRWSINLVADVTTFFDNEGRRTSSSRTSARTTRCRTPSRGSRSGTGL